jgi:hypothetical protein
LGAILYGIIMIRAIVILLENREYIQAMPAMAPFVAKVLTAVSIAGENQCGGSLPRSDAAQSRRLARAFLVEFFPRFENFGQMSARPRTERLHSHPQRAAELGQFVIHALRCGGEDGPLHQTVSL